MFAPDYMRQPPAWFSARILVGPGAMLTSKFVRDNHISHVINCAQDAFCPDWWKMTHPEKYAVLNAIDSPDVNILRWYPAFEHVLRRFLRESPLESIVYVHCHAGMNRSASLALAYVCLNYSLPFNLVVSVVRRQRPCILQNIVFMSQVDEFVNHGRLQSSENTRLDVDRVHDRDSGLFTSEHSEGTEGLEDTASSPPGGDGEPPQ